MPRFAAGYGLTTCEGGFGSEAQGARGCSDGASTIRALSDGELTYNPLSYEPHASTDDIVADLDLLLTSGRLHPANRRVIASAYDAKLAQTGSKRAALRLAQELFTLAPEFHTTTTNSLRASPRSHGGGGASSSRARPYRAVVYINLQGGCDSFNVLVPHSNCVNASGGPHDLFADYTAVRGPIIALTKR